MLILLFFFPFLFLRSLNAKSHLTLVASYNDDKYNHFAHLWLLYICDGTEHMRQMNRGQLACLPRTAHADIIRETAQNPHKPSITTGKYKTDCIFLFVIAGKSDHSALIA